MRNACLLALILSTVSSQALAQSWFFETPAAPSSEVRSLAWSEAVQRLAQAKRPEDSRALLAQIPSLQEKAPGRWRWLRQLLQEWQAYGADWDHPIGLAYSNHNVFLFLKTEGVTGLRLDDAFHRANRGYRLAFGLFARGDQTQEITPPEVGMGWFQALFPEAPRDHRFRPDEAHWESLRLGWAGLHFERDQTAYAENVLHETSTLGRDLDLVLPEGLLPSPDEPQVFRGVDADFRMLLAYFYGAKGERMTAVRALRAAAELAPREVLERAELSDDYRSLRDFGPYQDLLQALRK